MSTSTTRDPPTESQQPAKVSRVSFMEISFMETATYAPTKAPPTATDEAKKVVLAALASLPESIQTFVLQQFHTFITLHKELEHLLAKKARFDDEEYFPSSARIKLNLTFSDHARKLCPDESNTAITNGARTILTVRKQLRQAILAAVDVEIDEASRVAVRLDCLGGGFKVLRAIVKTQ